MEEIDEKSTDSYYDISSIYSMQSEESKPENNEHAESSTTVYDSESIALDEDPELMQKIDEIKQMQPKSPQPTTYTVPFPIKEPILFTENFTSLKSIPTTNTTEQLPDLDLSTSSPNASINPDELSDPSQVTFYRKLAASQLRKKAASAAEKPSKNSKLKEKTQRQRELILQEFEEVKRVIYDEEIPELAKIFNVKVEEITEMLERAMEFEGQEIENQELEDEILKLQQRLAKASPINDKFIEDIGRIQFKYKEQEKRDYGLTVEDLMSLPENTFKWLCLDQQEFDGLGDVDISFYMQLQQRGIIVGTRHYKQSEAREQEFKLGPIREVVIDKYPSLYGLNRKGMKAGESKNSNKNQMVIVKQKVLEKKLKKKAKNDERKAKKLGK